MNDIGLYLLGRNVTVENLLEWGQVPVWIFVYYGPILLLWFSLRRNREGLSVTTIVKQLTGALVCLLLSLYFFLFPWVAGEQCAFDECAPGVPQLLNSMYIALAIIGVLLLGELLVALWVWDRRGVASNPLINPDAKKSKSS